MTAAASNDELNPKDRGDLIETETPAADNDAGDDPHAAFSASSGDAAGGIKLDPEIAYQIRQEMLAEQNFPLGLLAGVLTAIVSAFIWAGVTVATHYQIGYMAIGVGFLVGWSVRQLGRGRSKVFAFLAAACALFGCVLGNLLSTLGFVAIQQGIPIADMFAAIMQQPAILSELMVETFSPIDLLFYGIAAYTGFQLGCHEIEPTEIYERFGQRQSA